MKTEQSIEQLEGSLNSFSDDERLKTLAILREKLDRGVLQVTPEQDAANMHCHTFYSFNAYGYSPSGLAWLAKKRGYALLGIVDFDVLDAVGEFLNACFLIGVRGSAALETRVFIPEFSKTEINSPGEPGVYYYMGIGFTSSKAPAEAAPILADMRDRAKQRNITMLERINAYLSPVTVDYNRDVLILTPAGNATERHMLAAYTKAANEQLNDPILFWSEKLMIPVDQVATQIENTPVFQNTIRTRLMKRGGVGYTQPEAGSFPTFEEVTRMITACQALPCATWLDGTTTGEQAIDELLELLIDKGVVALNIVPDRNWNINDLQVRQKKVNNLYKVVDLARQLDLPLNVGTEMNAHGQKLIDDFNAPELAPVRKDFMDGAYFIYGHTIMQRVLGLGYQSNWAKDYLPTRSERNSFYTQIGRKVQPCESDLAKIKQISDEAAPTDFLKHFERH